MAAEDLGIADLDTYGADGWELVAVHSIAGVGAPRRYIFKRPGDDPADAVIDVAEAEDSRARV
jgi:hypothetical protein